MNNPIGMQIDFMCVPTTIDLPIADRATLDHVATFILAACDATFPHSRHAANTLIEIDQPWTCKTSPRPPH